MAFEEFLIGQSRDQDGFAGSRRSGHGDKSSQAAGRTREFSFPSRRVCRSVSRSIRLTFSVPKKVLIIEDQADYRQLMGEVLSMEGWRVLEAGDGDAGFEMVSKERPDVVLCDLLMPRSNGFLVCRKIRNDFTLRHTKIVVTSGRDYDSDRLAAREAGADDYLTKPIKPYDLLALIARLTDETTIITQHEVVEPTLPPLPARMKFWGVRGSVPTPGPGTLRYGGNTTCIEVRAQNQIMILDGGTGLRPLGRELLAEFQDQPMNITLLLTHTHWDHIQGLPFFTPIYQP